MADSTGDLAGWLGHELEMISQAPILFIASVAAVGFVIWRVMQWHFKNRLEDAGSRNQLLQDRLDDYKDKLSGATPDAAKARIDALEARIQSLEPPRLEEAQRVLMRPFLDQHRGANVHVSVDTASPNAVLFARGLQATLDGSGWIVTSSAVMGISRPPPSGTGVIVQDPTNLGPHEQAIASALRAAGIAFDIQADRIGSRRRPDEGSPPVEILLTTRGNI